MKTSTYRNWTFVVGAVGWAAHMTTLELLRPIWSDTAGRWTTGIAVNVVVMLAGFRVLDWFDRPRAFPGERRPTE